MLLQVNAFGEHVEPGECKMKEEVMLVQNTPQTPSLVTSDTFTCVIAISLISVIQAVVDAVAVVGLGYTAPFIALEGVSRAIGKWRDRVVLDAGLVLELHAIGAATHSAVRGGEAEVAAPSVWHPVAVTFDR